MSEGVKPYNPESDKPSEFMGNWADGPVAEVEESSANDIARAKEMEELDVSADQELYQRMDQVDKANYYRDNWDEFSFEEQVEASQFMLDHPEFILGSGHTKIEFQEILNRNKAIKNPTTYTSA